MAPFSIITTLINAVHAKIQVTQGIYLHQGGTAQSTLWTHSPQPPYYHTAEADPAGAWSTPLPCHASHHGCSAWKCARLCAGPQRCKSVCVYLCVGFCHTSHHGCSAWKCARLCAGPQRCKSVCMYLCVGFCHTSHHGCSAWRCARLCAGPQRCKSVCVCLCVGLRCACACMHGCECALLNSCTPWCCIVLVDRSMLHVTCIQKKQHVSIFCME